MKYGNKKTVVNGIAFDSRKEARRYKELLLLQQAGKITDLKLQTEYMLIPAQYENFERYGKRGQRLQDGRRCIERAVTYKADFVYTENGKTIVEDVKGVKTEVYKIKRKLMLSNYGIKIREI